MSKLVENFFDAINIISQNNVDAAKNDATIDAEIKSIVNVDLGHYKVAYQGNYFDAFALDPLVTYKKEERVYVLVPQGDFSQRKVILGKSAFKNNSAFQDQQDMTNFYIEKGPNWITDWYELGHESPLQICAVDEDYKTSLVHISPYEQAISQIELLQPKLDKARAEYEADPTNQTKRLTWMALNNEMAKVQAEAEEALNGNQTGGANYYDFGFIRGLPEVREGYNRYPQNYPDEETLEKADNQVQRYSKAFGAIKVSASFSTNFQNVHDHGQYSLVVECIQKNPHYLTDPSHPDMRATMGEEFWQASKNLVDFQSSIDIHKYEVDKVYKAEVDQKNAELQEVLAKIAPGQPQYKVVTFELGFPSFTGAPYNYVSPSPQKAYFAIEKGSLLGLNRIYLKQDGRFTADIIPTYKEDGTILWDTQNSVLDSNNIFCEEIDIRFCEKVNLTETLYYAWIETPFGDALYGAGTVESNIKGRGYVDLIAHLQYGYQDILSQESCECHWFIEDPQVTSEFAERNEWPRDKHNNTEFQYGGDGWYPIQMLIDEGNANYSIDFNTLSIRRDAVLFKNNYKCVIVYRDISSEHQSEVTRQEALQQIVRLDSKYDLELVQETSDSGKDILLHIVDHNKPFDKIDVLTNDYYREWFGIWWLKDQAGSYRQISNGIEQGPFKINDFLYDEIATFYVECYDPYVIDPSAENIASHQTEKVCVLMKVIITAQEGDLLVDWVGKTTFNYDALGTLRGDADKRDNTLIPILRWADGRATDYVITVYGPDGSPLSNREFYDKVSETHSGIAHNWVGLDGKPRTMLKNMWVDLNNTIHFQVQSQYSSDLATEANNTFTIRIDTLSGQYYEIKKTVLFYKDGDMGTMGSDWSAPIRPCNWKYGQDKEEGPYIEELNYIAPLVLTQRSDGTFVQDKDFRVFLRPFVTKNGVPLEAMDPFEGYFCKVYWDVRMPGSAAQKNVKYASYLRLHHTDGLPSDSNNPGHIYGRQKSWYETGGVELNGSAVQDEWNSKVNEMEKEKDGLVAFTMYPRKQYEKEDGRFAEENYGALEVRFFDNQKFGTGADMEDMMYRFIVKAQVDIMKGQYDQENKIIQTEGDIERIASITSYWPIDILVNSDNLNFNDTVHFPEIFDPVKKIDTNWPRFVMYNATGYDPVNPDEPLSFKFGPLLSSEKLNYRAYNLTPLTQTLVEEIDPTTQAKIQKYAAKPHLNLSEGFHGALRLDPTEKSPFGSGYFIRNQVMYLNAYGNVDINGWDGQGIDMNEEDGTIFANTIGAGYKVPQTNLFTGVLMGVDRSQKKKDIPGYKGSLDDEAFKHMQYMTGLFGYQDGISSFGILENGTAYFGRADRGGRIVIDGANATIYGGGNGIMDSPSIGDPMWNTMRLTLVDLNHSTSALGKNADGYYIYNYNGKYFVKNANGKFEEVKDYAEGTHPIFTGVKNGQKDYYTQGFDGKYFNLHYGNKPIEKDELPVWYARLWQWAYIKPDGALPWWLNGEANNTNENYSGTSVENYLKLDLYTAIADDNLNAPDGFHGSEKKNYRINYFGPMQITNGQYVGEDYYQRQGSTEWVGDRYNDLADYLNNHENDVFGKLYHSADKKPGQDVLDPGQLSGFGPSRASTTPAIEIGQHVHGLMPGLLDWSMYYEIFETLAIPGDRNFLVTYDGTLWAMNGVFMGAVIGSNIVGGRIQGAEIGIGFEEGSKDLKIWAMKNGDPDCNYLVLKPPRDVLVALGELGMPDNVAFYVSPKGEVFASKLYIYGGSIDIGRFHILGGKGVDDEDYGHLIQIAESDFVGPTHFYGNVGIGPNAGGGRDDLGNKYGSNYGMLVQTHGVAAFGVLLPNGTDTDIHGALIDRLRQDGDPYYSDGWKSSPEAMGSPGVGGEPTVEKSAMLAVNSTDATVPTNANSKGYFEGHFWPMHFHYGHSKTLPTGSKVQPYEAQRNSYMTTMDIFKAEGLTVSNDDAGQGTNIKGCNYFRIGPYGNEAMMIFFRKNWQTQYSSEVPRSDNGAGQNGNALGPDNYLGWMGLTNRSGYGSNDNGKGITQFSMGMTTWYTAPIIFQSDGESAWLTRGHLHFFSQYWGGNVGTDETMRGDTKCGVMFTMGGKYNSGVAGSKPASVNKVYLHTQEGSISIGVHGPSFAEQGGALKEPWSPAIPGFSNTLCGLLLDPGNLYPGVHNKVPGVHLYCASDGKYGGGKSELHIVHRGTKQAGRCSDANSNMTEILLDEDSMYLYARKRILMQYGKDGSAHKLKETYGEGGGSSATPENTVIQGDENSTLVTNPKMVCIYVGSKDNSNIAELTLSADRSNLWNNKACKIGTGGTPHEPTNYMHFAQSTIDMKGAYATPDNQFHIYARFG